MNLKDSQTLLNLTKAYSGECQAQNRYKFIEYGARYNGYNCLAEVVDKIIYNEFNHARMFYTYIQKAQKEPIENITVETGTPFKQKWDLVENLKFAAEDEQAEVKIYSKFSKIAFDEGFKDIGFLFAEIGKIEAKHNKIFNELFEKMANNCLYKSEKKVKWKCSGCGYEHVGTEAPKICPVCQAKQGVFLLNLKNCC